MSVQASNSPYPDGEVGGPRAKAQSKPWAVEYWSQWRGRPGRWVRCGHYTTKARAEQACETLNKTRAWLGWTHRVVGP